MKIETEWSRAAKKYGEHTKAIANETNQTFSVVLIQPMRNVPK